MQEYDNENKILVVSYLERIEFGLSDFIELLFKNWH